MPAKKKPDSDVESAYPNVAAWARDFGWIEIENMDWQGFVVRALDGGGMIFEKDGCKTFSEAMAALEKGIEKWFDEQ
jgi:hypothetical protein